MIVFVLLFECTRTYVVSLIEVKRLNSNQASHRPQVLLAGKTGENEFTKFVYICIYTYIHIYECVCVCVDLRSSHVTACCRICYRRLNDV